jgi:UDP-N-acetyl-2-amino-2-deoxyglucuronate dehydrogenase
MRPPPCPTKQGVFVKHSAVRYAIIGAGMGAETHAAELPHVEGAVLEAIYARDPQKAEAF